MDYHNQKASVTRFGLVWIILPPPLPTLEVILPQVLDKFSFVPRRAFHTAPEVQPWDSQHILAGNSSHWLCSFRDVIQ